MRRETDSDEEEEDQQAETKEEGNTDDSSGRSTSTAASRGPWLITRMLNWIFSIRYDWVDTVPNSHFTARYGGLFAAYRARCHLFLLFELWISFAAGVVGGLILPGDETRCERLLITVTVLNAVTLAAMVLIRRTTAASTLSRRW